MPQNTPRTTRRGIGGLNDVGGTQTLPTRMRGPVDQRDYVLMTSQAPRYGLGGKADIPEAANVHSQGDPM